MLVAAYDIDAFTEVSTFNSLMEEWMEGLKNTPVAPGHERVLVPGQPEDETYKERIQSGIPLHPEVIDWFRDICTELEVPFPMGV